MKSKNLSEKILKSVKGKGFKYIELPSVIETNHIVQRSGENFRKFIFSFIDQNGNELCLRPDLTIVSCLRYLESNLRDNNINAEVFLNTKKNLGKQLDLANKRELTVAIICGENEFKDNTVTIKNLRGVKGENNQTIPKSNLINEIKKLI